MNTASDSPAALALISVSDKTGIIEFASALAERGYGLLSTGGTAKALADAGLAVTEVSDFTGSPEIMGGRVKTLHPKVHGGLLGRAGVDEAVMAEQDIPRIDMAVINLYPFEQVTADPKCRFEDAIETLDIAVSLGIADPVEFLEILVAFELADDTITVEGHHQLATEFLPSCFFLTPQSQLLN